MYTSDQVDYLLLVGQALTATGDKGGWTPGYTPHFIRSASIVLTTVESTTGPVINFTTQPTAGSNVGITAGDIAILKVLTTHAAGQVIYKDVIEKLVIPGQRLVVNVGVAGASAVGDIHIYAEPSPEVPNNNPKMIATT